MPSLKLAQRPSHYQEACGHSRFTDVYGIMAVICIMLAVIMVITVIMSVVILVIWATVNISLTKGPVTVDIGAPPVVLYSL